MLQVNDVVSLKSIPGLDAITDSPDSLTLGALATHQAIATSPVVRRRLPVLGQLANTVGNVRVRTMGTLGGNLCFAEPHADPGTLLVALGAEAQIAGAADRRRMPLEAFFVGPYETCLGPDELLAGLRVPLLGRGEGAAYTKFGWLERPSVGAAAWLRLDQHGSIALARVTVGCASPFPRRVETAERCLLGVSAPGLTRAARRAGQD
jgi:carbon-monoxide dehydrogenase medium subunit